MPSLGDFFRIGLPRSFCVPWDAWLQEVLVFGQSALGARWSDAYMSAPIWRFLAAPGTVDSLAVAGVVMPSVDRVGRRFPLTLAAQGRAVNEDGFAALEEIALAALDDDMTKDRLTGVLANVPTLDAGSNVRGVQWQAVWGESTLEFTSTGLPQGRQALPMFDIGLWPDAEPLAQDAPA